MSDCVACDRRLPLGLGVAGARYDIRERLLARFGRGLVKMSREREICLRAVMDRWTSP